MSLQNVLLRTHMYAIYSLNLIHFVFSVGSQDLKCLCKHSFTEHQPNTKKCQKPGCKTCHGFTSKHGCNCPLVYDEHQTVFESREEREAVGRPVDPKWMQEQNVIYNLHVCVDDCRHGRADLRLRRFGARVRPSGYDESSCYNGQSIGG